EILNRYAGSIDRLTSGRGRLAHGYVCIDDDARFPNLGAHHDSYTELIEACSTAADQPETPRFLPRPRPTADLETAR
ncbi:hypothetical protein ATKI12_8908, partial [Kitasatospora sp. Ki12]